MHRRRLPARRERLVEHRGKVVGHALQGPAHGVVAASAVAGPLIGKGAGFLGDEPLDRASHRRGNGDAPFEDDQRVTATRNHGGDRSVVRQPYLSARQPGPGVVYAIRIAFPRHLVACR